MPIVGSSLLGNLLYPARNWSVQNLQHSACQAVQSPGHWVNCMTGHQVGSVAPPSHGRVSCWTLDCMQGMQYFVAAWKGSRDDDNHHISTSWLRCSSLSSWRLQHAADISFDGQAVCAPLIAECFVMMSARPQVVPRAVVLYGAGAAHHRAGVQVSASRAPPCQRCQVEEHYAESSAALSQPSMTVGLRRAPRSGIGRGQGQGQG